MFYLSVQQLASGAFFHQVKVLFNKNIVTCRKKINPFVNTVAKIIPYAAPISLLIFILALQCYIYII